MSKMKSQQEAAKELHAMVWKFGDAATDVFEQMLKGNWKDDQGHDVKMNQAMFVLADVVKSAIALNATINCVESNGARS